MQYVYCVPERCFQRDNLRLLIHVQNVPGRNNIVLNNKKSHLAEKKTTENISVDYHKLTSAQIIKCFPHF